jgi:hypothetical protein
MSFNNGSFEQHTGLKQLCPKSTVKFTGRQNNVVTHELTKTVVYMVDLQVLELMSNCIIDTIDNDMR